MYGTEYIKIVNECVNRAWDTQQIQIRRAADQLCHAIIRKNNIFVFGCSHAGILAEEVFYRTGGLAVINPILFQGVMLNTRPITMTSKLERLSGLAAVLLAENHVKADDVLIIHSVSGRNTVPVEMAQEAARLGVHTVCITNLNYSRTVTSRAPSGRRLFEVCDIVIDNCGAAGDASIALEGLEEKIGPTSTAVGAVLMNALVIETVELLLNNDIIPPIFMSANLNDGDEHNEQIFEKYKDNIFYM